MHDRQTDVSPAPSPSSPRLRHSVIAVAVLFFVNGATFSNWLPRIPEIRDSLGIGNAGLGATLLGAGAGGLVGSLLVGRTMDRTGSRRLLVLAASALSVGLPLVAVVPHPVLLLVVLTALGMLDVANDVAMNAQGVIVQQQLGRSIMNRLHATWSLGFTVGAVVGSIAAALEIAVEAHLALVGGVLLVTVLVARRWLVALDPPLAADQVDRRPGRPRPGRRSPLVAAMALAALAAAALEFTPNEWAAVLMRDEFDAGRGSGAGTVAVAVAMLVGRLLGDHVLDRVGQRRLLLGAIDRKSVV